MEKIISCNSFAAAAAATCPWAWQCNGGGGNCTCAKKRCKISPPFLLLSSIPDRYPISHYIGGGTNNSYFHLPLPAAAKRQYFHEKMSDMICSTYASLHSAAAAESSSPSSWLLAKKIRERSCTRTLGMRLVRIFLTRVLIVSTVLASTADIKILIHALFVTAKKPFWILGF